MNPNVSRLPCRWLLGRAGLYAAVAWGLSEATLFFLVPDVLLTATALFSVKASLRQMAAAVAGSLIGGAAMFGLALHHPVAAGSLVRHVPFVSQGMFDKVDGDFRASGVWALCEGPLSGVPYKVYAVEAPPHARYVPFLLVSVPARLERLAVMWALFAALGVSLRRQIRTHPRGAIGLHALCWILIYAHYWSVI